MCIVLGVSKSGFYRWLNHQNNDHRSEKETYKKELRKKIKKSFYESMGTYGSPRVHDDLVEWGYIVSRKTVARMMKKMGLKATPRERYVVTTDSNHNLNIYPNLIKRQFNVAEPNKVWAADITYIWTIEGWIYLATIMDLFSRKIVGWSLDSNMKKQLTLQALNRALELRRPQPSDELIHHSDRGSQYCSKEYIDLLNEQEIRVSMSRQGDPYDNACIESFHANLKKDLVYRRRFKTRAEAVQAINHYISAIYNERRKHSTLGYCSPNKFERDYQNSKQNNVS